jgi:hypothetical protein
MSPGAAVTLWVEEIMPYQDNHIVISPSFANSDTAVSLMKEFITQCKAKGCQVSSMLTW